jgi:hypothetical protein
MINPKILALPNVAIAMADPLHAFSATWRAFSSSANNFSRVYSISIASHREARFGPVGGLAMLSTFAAHLLRSSSGLVWHVKFENPSPSSAAGLAFLLSLN